MPTAPYYTQDGKRVPGVTTIIGRFKPSDGLIHWAWSLGSEGKDYRAERDKAADCGTLAHAMIEAWLAGKDPEDVLFGADPGLEEKARQAFGMAREWWEGQRFELVEQECHLVSEAYRYGGTPDCIVRDAKGRLALADWKSSNRLYSDHLIQCAAYVQLWNENRPEPITGGVHIGRFSKEWPDFEHRYFAEVDEAWSQFVDFRRCYDRDKVLRKRV